MSRKPSRHLKLRIEWPKIHDLRPKSKYFMVDGRPYGRREYFKTVAEAKARADQLAVERANRGTEALAFSTEHRVMAAECISRLRPFGKSLRDATDHYVAHLEAEAKRRETLLVSQCLNLSTNF